VLNIVYSITQNYTTMRNNDGIQSVQRAFSILEVIANHPAGLGVTEIARRVDLPKSTVARFLTTLEGVKAIERLAAGEGYIIGSRLITLVSQVPFSRHLVTVAHPFLQELTQASGETSHLCLPDGNQTLYIDQVNSLHHIQIQDWIGYRVPLHAVSNGKIFMAYWSEAQLEQYLARPLEKFAQETITDPTVLRQHLKEIAAQGYAWAYKEFDDEVAGVAAPIWNERGQVVASVSVGGPIHRFPPPEQTEALATIVVEIGRKITGHIQ
jgi:DNA-binding IclR family transcriptional regulator